ncbi:MAG: LacI family transcriptional regulator [Caldilineales bacterium]|nr:LacI family transcriptional regulator [Caldilineales bacterium]MDW8317856.1 LacI family DNA-binding transcriptional regulator [Anaerolineae bacterium]
MATPTIRDVAREAGVSTATVSYVLNDSRRVAEETRQRVLQAAQRLGYRANIIARNLQASETRLLGYTWRPTPPDQFNPILDQFLNAIAQAAARHEYHILTFPTTSIEEEIAIYREMVLTGQVDGFVLSNTNLDDPRVRALLEIGFPFVAFGRSNPQWDFPWVDVDGVHGVVLATQHLLERGHRRIGCLAWPEASLTGQYRLEGYRRTMAEAGLAVDPAWIMRTENTYEDAYRTACAMLSLPSRQRPSAIIALSDLMAIGAMNAAADLGLEVGRELAVVGFDDAPVARFLRPPLSSLAQPIPEVGERLATMLIDLVNGRQPAEPHVLLKPTLVVRASSAFRYTE